MRSPLLHLVFALLIGLLVSGGYAWWYTILSQKSNEAAVLQGQIAVLQQQSSRVAAARAALAEITDDEARVQNYFVSEDTIVSFINVLQQAGAAQGATLKVLSVSKGGTTAQSTLVLALSIKGSFDAVMRTIGTIEYAPYALSIATLSVAQDPQKGWDASLTITVGSTPAPVAPPAS